MSTESESDFENRLRRQTQARPNPAWRREILAASRAEVAKLGPGIVVDKTPRRPPERIPWFQEWFPLPLRVPLAIAWLLTAYFGIASMEFGEVNRFQSDVLVDRSSGESTRTASKDTLANTYLALRQRIDPQGNASMLNPSL